jgi:hypothetical protein
MRTAISLFVAAIAAVGCSTTAEDVETPQTSDVATTTTAPSPTVTSASTLPTSASSSTLLAETTTAATTLPQDPVAAGVALAQQLASAYADGDWETARRISPLPEWDDATYEEGFAGLEASTIWLGGTDENEPGRVGLYLLQVAHELRAGSERTSAYCVRWDFLTATSTIQKVAGELLAQEPGFTPHTDLQRRAAACNAFDEASPYPTSPTPPDDAEWNGPLFEPPAAAFDPATCTFRGISLWGNVRVVRSSGDIKVTETSFRPDIRVSVDPFIADSCGEWKFVRFGEDFTIQFVRTLPDVRVEFLGQLPDQ